MPQRRLLRGAVAATIAVAVPAAVWWIDDAFPLEAVVLGPVLAFIYWCWEPDPGL